MIKSTSKRTSLLTDQSSEIWISLKMRNFRVLRSRSSIRRLKRLAHWTILLSQMLLLLRKGRKPTLSSNPLKGWVIMLANHHHRNSLSTMELETSRSWGKTFQATQILTLKINWSMKRGTIGMGYTETMDMGNSSRSRREIFLKKLLGARVEKINSRKSKSS